MPGCDKIGKGEIENEKREHDRRGSKTNGDVRTV